MDHRPSIIHCAALIVTASTVVLGGSPVSARLLDRLRGANGATCFRDRMPCLEAC